MKILMVDDDENCMELWTRMLSGLNASLLFARTVEEAIRLMAEIPPPDLVLLDLRIPPHGAPETLAAVHLFRQFNPNLSVIAISGMRLEEILMAIETANVVIQGAITKEDAISQSRLLASVKAALVTGQNYKDTMATIETVNQKVVNAEAKKRTDAISLPIIQPLTPDDSTRK